MFYDKIVFVNKRIPVIIKSIKNTLIAFVEENCVSSYGKPNNIIFKKSFDNGLTWTREQF